MIFLFQGQITQTVDLQNVEGGKKTVKSTLDPAYFSTVRQFPALLPSTHLQSPIQQIKPEPAELTMPFSANSSCFSQGSPFSSPGTKIFPLPVTNLTAWFFSMETETQGSTRMNAASQLWIKMADDAQPLLGDSAADPPATVPQVGTLDVDLMISKLLGYKNTPGKQV